VKTIGPLAEDVQAQVDLAGRFFFQTHGGIFLTAKAFKHTQKIWPLPFPKQKRANKIVGAS
jgi:hypothetical protein